MNKTFILILIFIIPVLFSCKENNNQTTGNEYNITNQNSSNANIKGTPIITFKELEYNFGTLIQGEKVAHSFVFTNTGGGNLIISNVSASCGCTAPKWSREPIPAGGTGKIEVVFDSKGRDGKQTKTVKVYSNTEPNVTDLVIRCDIVN